HISRQEEPGTASFSTLPKEKLGCSVVFLTRALLSSPEDLNGGNVLVKNKDHSCSPWVLPDLSFIVWNSTLGLPNQEAQVDHRLQEETQEGFCIDLQNLKNKQKIPGDPREAPEDEQESRN
ncbi:hypothetical protein D4764_02G0006150, partial [Takifugu flavidus]